MKTILFLLLIILSLGAKAQRTNESEYVITGYKYNNKVFHNDSYADGHSRIKIYTEDGNQYLDVFDCCGWTFQGIIENNDIPREEIARSSTQYRSTLVHKTWKNILTVYGEVKPMKTREISFILSYHPEQTMMYMSIRETGTEYTGYQIK